jgi:hypothetical protein
MKRLPETSLERTNRSGWPRRRLLQAGGLIVAVTALPGCSANMLNGNANPGDIPPDTRPVDLYVVADEALLDSHNPDSSQALKLAAQIATRRAITAPAFAARVQAALQHPDRLPQGSVVLSAQSVGRSTYAIANGVRFPGHTVTTSFAVEPGEGGKLALVNAVVTAQQGTAQSVEDVHGNELELQKRVTPDGKVSWQFVNQINESNDNGVAGWPQASPDDTRPAGNLAVLRDMNIREQDALKFMLDSAPALQQ